MDKWLKKTIELGAGLFFTGKSNPSVIPYYPQKVEISGEEERYFVRTYPEHMGVSSGRILAMLRALEKEKRANIHNLLVIKDGVVISECSHPGYSVNTWHLSHSMSKTVTGMAIGMLVDDGVLSVDTRVVDLFPGTFYKDKRFEKMTVKHLLTMQSGVKFAEAGSVSESHWSEAFFESSLAFAPGERFAYNSMNSYILARIVKELTGRSLTDFLKERLFDPLEIKNVFWEVGPEGIEKGGWGLYMSVESWAKLGIMMLSGGEFGGKRILSRRYVRESIQRHSATPDVVGHFDYGYQLWTSKTDGSFLFNGMLGQNVWVCPRNNLVIALNSGNNELFQNGPALAIIERYMGQDLSRDITDSCFAGDLVDLRRAEEHFFECRHWVRPAERQKGLGYRLGFRRGTPYIEAWDELLGRYNFTKNNYGMIPLIVRAMQNNLKNSIDGVAFEKVGDSLFMSFNEGGCSYRLEVGLYDFKETVLEYHGERYMVNVIGEAMEDEDRNMLFKVELLFPEMPNTRMLKFSVPEDGRLLMRMSELPNENIANDLFEDLAVSNPKLAFALDMLERRIGRNFIRRKLHSAFAPELIGAKVGSESYTKTLDEEREKQKAGAKNNKVIDAVIDKFLKEDEDEEDEEPRAPFRAFLSEVMERIKAKLPKPQPTSSLPESSAQALPSPSDFGKKEADTDIRVEFSEENKTEKPE